MVDLRAQVANGDSIVDAGEAFHSSIRSTRVMMGEIRAVLVELVDDILRFESATNTSSVSAATKEALDASVSKATEIVTAISRLEASSMRLGPIYTQGSCSVHIS
jgi:hypothetical protein